LFCAYISASVTPSLPIAFKTANLTVAERILLVKELVDSLARLCSCPTAALWDEGRKRIFSQ
jgi:hypothetical protein